MIVLAFQAYLDANPDEDLRLSSEAHRRASGQDPALEARAVHVLGVAQSNAEQLDEAQATLADALDRFTSLGLRHRAADTRVDQAFIESCFGRFNEALDLLDAAEPDLGDDDASVAWYHYCRGVVQHNRGEIEASSRCLAVAIPASERIGDGRRAAMALLYQAHNHKFQDHLALALESYLEARRRFAELGIQFAEALTLQYIAEMLARLGEIERATGYSQQALALAHLLEHSRLEGEILMYLGRFQMAGGDLAGAAELQRQALAIADRVGDRQARAQVRLELGLIAESSDPEAALEHFRAVLPEATDTHLESSARFGIGRRLAARGDIEDAAAEFETALALAERSGFSAIQAAIHGELAELHERGGRLGLALRHARAAHRFDREVLEQRSGERMQVLALGFELEQQEQRVDEEQARNAELEKINAQLEARDAQNAELLEQLRAQARELVRLSRTDGLTGLDNRLFFEEQLREEFAVAKRRNSELCVALADIDDFKMINDHFSHQVGDRVLREVGTIFREVARSSDTVARYGGEELVIVLPNTSLAGGATLCERIRRRVADAPWGEIAPGLSVTVSIGVAADRHAVDHEKLLALADAKLYEAKRAGKNRVVDSAGTDPVNRRR